MGNEYEGAGWRNDPETIARARKLLAEINGRPSGPPIVETKLAQEPEVKDGQPPDAPPEDGAA